MRQCGSIISWIPYIKLVPNPNQSMTHFRLYQTFPHFSYSKNIRAYEEGLWSANRITDTDLFFEYILKSHVDHKRWCG